MNEVEGVVPITVDSAFLNMRRDSLPKRAA